MLSCFAQYDFRYDVSTRLYIPFPKHCTHHTTLNWEPRMALDQDQKLHQFTAHEAVRDRWQCLMGKHTTFSIAGTTSFKRLLACVDFGRRPQLAGGFQFNTPHTTLLFLAFAHASVCYNRRFRKGLGRAARCARQWPTRSICMVSSRKT